MSSFRELSRNHDFTALWIGQTVSDLGTQMSAFVYPLLAYALTGSAVLAGLTEAANLLGMALTVLPAGVLADRIHPGWLMRLASASGAILYGSLFVTALAGVLSLAQLLGVALLTGVGAGLFAPAEMSAIRSIVAEKDLPVALSQNEARSHVATLVGAPLAGVLYAVTRSLPFLVDAISYAVSWITLGRIRADLAPERSTTRQRPRVDAAEGLRFVWQQPFYRAMLLYSPAANLVVNALFVTAILRLIEAGTAPWAIGFVDVAAGLSGLLGAAVAPRIVARMATGRLTAVTAWIRVPLLIPMAFRNDPAVVAVALAAVFFLIPAGKAGIGSYRLAITPPNLVGRVQAASRFANWSTLPLAPILGGALLSTLGGPTTITVLIVLTACVALIPTLNHTIRTVPRPAQWHRGDTVPRETAPASQPE
ncbi:MAG: MFS transporter [Jatrophihabitantaceae bacterium]